MISLLTRRKSFQHFTKQPRLMLRVVSQLNFAWNNIMIEFSNTRSTRRFRMAHITWKIITQLSANVLSQTRLMLSIAFRNRSMVIFWTKLKQIQLLLYSRLLINSNLSVNSYLTHQTQSLIYKTVCKSQETNRGKKAVFKVQIRKETINNLSSSKPQSYNA